MPKIEADTATGVESFDAVENRKLVLAIKDAGIDILHRCGGNAKCTTCRVEIIEGDVEPMQELERERLAREDKLEPNTRLSCQIRVHGDMHIKVLRQASVTGLEPGTVPAE